MSTDRSGWSGEGTFTQVLLDRLEKLGGVVAIRVEDAPASRSEADYNFISNEIYVTFDTRTRKERVLRFGFLPAFRKVDEEMMTMADLDTALAADPDVGAADYADETMLQYLRTERIIPPYQTRGYKLVEMVRIYRFTALRTAPAPSG
jgi:hypothetical protein